MNPSYVVDSVRTRYRYAELQGCSGHHLRILALQDKIYRDYEEARRQTNRICRQDCVEEDFVCIRQKALAGGIRRKWRGG